MSTSKSSAKSSAKPAKKVAKRAAKQTTKAAGKKSGKVRVTAARSAEEVFAAVEARAAELGVPLRAGATAREITRTEKACGVSLPDELRAWYRRHDGTEGADPFLWPLELIRDSWESYEFLLGPGPMFPLGGIEDSISYIDLSPAGGGRIFHGSAETGSEPQFATFLEWLASFDWDWDLA